MALKDHLNKLEYFCAIVDCKSILKASYKIGITQPQLSRVVKQLEGDLEKQLLVRTSTGIAPTKDGIDLYQSASEVILQISDVEKKIKFGQIDIQGTVKVGTYDSIARYFFPSFLKYLKAAMPGLEVHLETSRSSKIFDQVKKGTLDIGICVDSENSKFKSLEKQDIYTDAFGFYHHPAVSADFLDQIIIFPESMGFQVGNEKSFTKEYKFRSRILSDNLETVKSLSEEGVGVGLLPHRVAREAMLQGKLIPLKRLAQTKSLFTHRVVLCRKKSNQDTTIESLVSELIRFLSSWSKT